MAALSANDAYLSIGAVDVAAYAIDGTINLSAAAIDTSHGYNTDWTQVAGGLKTATCKFAIAYEVGSVSTYIQKLQAGETQAIIWGPEGSTAGQPKHHQTFLIDSVEMSPVTVGKDMVVFTVSGTSTGAPTTNMYAGGTW